jgi:hypothetical protein
VRGLAAWKGGPVGYKGVAMDAPIGGAGGGVETATGSPQGDGEGETIFAM